MKSNQFLAHFYNYFKTFFKAKNSSKQPVFIQELTITILKTNYDAKGKKLTKLKTFSEVFPILVRYIDNNILLSMKCIDAIIQFTNTYKCEGKIMNIFLDMI